MLERKYLWRLEVLSQGNVPSLLCLTFPVKNEQQL